MLKEHNVDFHLIQLISMLIQLMNLKYPRGDIRVLIKILQYLPSLQKKPFEMSLREEYFLFLEVKHIFPLLAILAHALGICESIIIPLMDRYFNPNDPVAHPIPLMNGNDLIQGLNIKPSPIIGELLTEIAIAKIENKIQSKEDGLIFAKNYINNLS